MSFSETEKLIIKKYPNRRLYDTSKSDYITLADVRQLVLKNIDFVVLDAKTSQELTRLILAQIIFEQESSGSYILNEAFLRQIIVFYDDNLSDILSYYLDLTIKNFASHQDSLRKISKDVDKALSVFSPVSLIEKIAEQNFNLFEQTMKLFFFDKKDK